MDKDEALKKIIQDTLWMARRYADGRSSYAVSLFNESVHLLDSLGLSSLLEADQGKRFADDGMFGVYDPTKRIYQKN